MKKKLMWLLMSVIVLMSSLTVYADDSALVEDVLAEYPDLPTSYTKNDVTYTFYHYILTKNNYGTSLYCYTNPSYSTYFANDTTVVLSVIENDYVMRFDLNSSGNKWNYGFLYGTGSGLCVDVDTIIYYSCDIYSNSDKTDVVFQGAPLLSVVGLTKNQMFQLTTKEILGLVPLVIGLIIFCLGLRKAWGMLYQLLHQA